VGRHIECLVCCIRDIEFFLEVEKSHCDYNKGKFGSSHKNLTRAAVRDSGFIFSGRFTPGCVRARVFSDWPTARIP